MEIEIKCLIADKINEQITKFGSTKTWIANRAGMSRQSLSSLMTSDNPTLESLIRIAIALDCDVSDLFIYIIHKDK